MADVAAQYPAQRPAQRPRTASMLSWGSHKSKDSAPKMDLTETERDKRRITGKADPSVAMNEIQPSVEAMQKSTLVPLRTMQFRDHKGDLITDPDRSNPTRPRMERPLDTIRSFEAAIDSSYSRRRNTAQPGKYNTHASQVGTQHDRHGAQRGSNSLEKEMHTKRFSVNSQAVHNTLSALSNESYSPQLSNASSSSSLNAKTRETPALASTISQDQDTFTHVDEDPVPENPKQQYIEPALTYMVNEDMQSRRSSFYQGLASPQPRTPGSFSNNPYFDRQPDSRPESIYDQPQQQQQQQQQYGGYQAGSSNGWNGNRRMPHGRMTSEPVYGHHQQRQHGYQQSYDTATASSSGTYQTEQGTASTEPSSYNGSYGEIHQAGHAKPQPPAHQESYGIEFANNEEDEYGQPINNYYQQSPQSPQSPQGQPGYGPNGSLARGRSYGSPIEASAPPPPPPHSNGNRNALRKPVGGNGHNNGAASGGYYPPSAGERPKPEKRKSWLSRRFSKQG